MSRNPLDLNARIGSLLLDMAAVQTSKEKMRAYKRAASTILSLEQPIETLVDRSGQLAKIPNIGPSSTRIILEVIRTAGSPTVERVVGESGRGEEVKAGRGLRSTFLSRAEAMRILKDASTSSVGQKDYRGDLQMHSEYSDGSNTLSEMAEGCIDRGYSYCAVTDHSYGLPIAGGVSMGRMAKQHQEIDELHKKTAGRFRMLKGVEANIRLDGTVDLTPTELAQFEVVLAAPHAKLRLKDDQTARMLTAVRTRGVHVLAHPRGRVGSSRVGIIARWDRVFAAAVKANVAIEIDGDPARQDLDHQLARQALEAGCVLAVDSDAHAVSQLRYADTALAHARLAGATPDRVINCWPLDRLLAWLRDR